MSDFIYFLTFQSCGGRLSIIEFSDIACGIIVLGIWFLMIAIPLAVFLTFQWLREGN